MVALVVHSRLAQWPDRHALPTVLVTALYPAVRNAQTVRDNTVARADRGAGQSAGVENMLYMVARRCTNDVKGVHADRHLPLWAWTHDMAQVLVQNPCVL